MAGPDFVHRSEEQFALARDVSLLLSLGPLWVRRRDEIDRRQVLLERPGDEDIREIPALVGRRFGDARLLLPGDRDEGVLFDKGAQLAQLLRRNLDRVTGHLVALHFRHTRLDRLARQDSAAGLPQGRKIALQVAL